jgi:caa(3)-type oxidase subunit IV
MAHHQGHSDGAHAHHPPIYYIKIYGWLLLLLVVSIIGPELGNRLLTLITAFGIAIVKALMVCAYFMHLNIEKRYIWYMLITMLLMVALFFAGTSADIRMTQGQNWKNQSALDLIEEHSKTGAETKAAEH